MLKIAYGSDLHLEFYNSDKISIIVDSWRFDYDTDVLIIAGDLHVGAEQVIECLQLIYDTYGIPIMYVPGNHEYYNSSFEVENKKFLDHGLDHDGYHILLSDKVEYKDVLFAGCYCNLDGSWKTIDAWRHAALNDFNLISDFEDRVVRGKHEHFQLTKDLSDSNCSNEVVITHIMPSPKCIGEKYLGSYLNPCFANNWEDIIYNFKPKFWVCGHTHEIGRVIIGNTDILINPMGYPKENPNWNWRYFNV